MEVEDHRAIRCEQILEIAIAEAVGMFRGGGQGEQLHHVHVADLQLRDLVAQDLDGCQALLGGDVPCRGQHHIRFIHFGAAVVIAGPVPDADPFGHVTTGLIQGQVLKMFLLVGDDDVGDIGLGEGLLGDGE